MEHPNPPCRQCCCMLAALDAQSCRLGPMEFDRSIIAEGVENPHRVRSTSDARYDRVGEPSGLLQDLASSLPTDYGLEIPDDHRIRMHSRS